MAELDKATTCDGFEPSHLHLEKDGCLSFTPATKKSRIQGFLDSLMEAHRYVQNRRSASLNN